MADEPMLSLFDSDASFLDELTNAADSEMGPSQSLDGPMMGSGMDGMPVDPLLGPMQQSRQPASQQSYNPQMANLSGNPYERMNSYQGAVPPQHQQYNIDSLNQYSPAPKLHHVSNPMAAMNNQGQTIMRQTSPQSMMSSQTSPHRPQQFGSPPAGSAMMQHQPVGAYQVYGMQGGPGPAAPGPRMPTPPHQQQMGIAQASVWNQNQNASNQTMYIQQQPQPQQIAGQMGGSMSTYLTHHDYAISTGQQAGPRLSHFPDPNASHPQHVYRLTSPPSGSVSSPNSIGGMGQIQQRSPLGTQPFSSISQPMNPQSNIRMANFGSAQQQLQQIRHKQPPQQQQFAAEFVRAGPNLNSGTTSQSNNFQHYQYPGQSQTAMSQGMVETAPPLSHYPNTSPTQTTVYKPGFPGLPQQRATAPSPRPTPPPPSLTPEVLSPPTSVQSQGTLGQSSLHQLQQLAAPQIGSSASPVSSPFQQIIQSDASSSKTVNSSAYSGGTYSTSSSPLIMGAGNVNMNSNIGISVNTNQGTRPNGPGPLSPNYVMNQNPQNQQNLQIEIQSLSQQLQQLLSMPKNPQNQEKMLSLQERIRILKAQQQQHILQMQRQKQQQQQQQQQQQHFQQQQQQLLQQKQLQHQQNLSGNQRQIHIQVQHVPQPPQQQTHITLPTSQQQQSPYPQQQQSFSPVSTPSPQKLHIVVQQQPTPPQQAVLSPPQVPATSITSQTTPPANNQVPISAQSTIVVSTIPTAVAPPQVAPISNDLPLDSQPPEQKKKKKYKPRTKKPKTHQDKANEIVAEAIAKAHAEGKDVPLVMSPGGVPTTVMDLEGGEGEVKEEKKVKTKKKSPKKKKPKEEKDANEETVPKEIKPKVEKPKAEKPKPVKKKKKPPATFLLKRKRKRKNSSDYDEVEVSKATPPPSPEDGDENSIQKRRSARNTGTKRKKYLDEVDLQLSEEDVDVEGTEGPIVKPENPSDDDAVVVEKILGMRIRRKDKDVEDEDDDEEDEVEEFYVKFKNFSYLHCDWRTAKELERDKRIHMKIKRYKMKRLQMNNYFLELDDEELFNPDYVEVDRVLDVSTVVDPITEEDNTHFLVKWRGLSYEESTWELQQDVDPEKVKSFYKFRELPPDEEREHKDRPKADDWEKMDESRPYKGGNELREYQLEGVNWLLFSWHNEQNCILADEMGLGKTIQSITFLLEMYIYGIKGPFLIVAPLSTIGNWQREFDTWTDMNAIVYHGTSPSRNMIQEYEMYYKDENGKKIPDLFRFNAMITTYEIIIADVELLSQIEWRCIIIDEAHRLKNQHCRLMEGLKCLDMEHRVLLTGTPLQNNVEELFSLLNFLEPKRFACQESFSKEFGNLKTESQVEKLKEILKPMMLRRLKEDVEKNLAPKTETIIEVELTNIQKKYYRAIIERNFSFLSKGTGSSQNVPNLMNTMMELRKCCNHPYLVKGAEEKILEETREKHGLDPQELFNSMVHSSGKLVLLDKLLPKLKENGHKVLIFSQMIRVLDILEDYLIHKKYLYERLDGRIRGNIRQEAIDRFSKPDSDRFVFLLCTRAGGLGINLTAADTVVIYDSDWNPQNDLQAQARCHRIGQNKAVKVYRLITRNSYEREMFDRASLKLGLDKAVLQSMGGDKPQNQQQQLSKKEIEELLRKGAYGALMEDDNAGDKFCEEDIDLILQRRTQVIQIETEGKGSTFAKASFSLSSNRSDIDINDPDFWNRWAKKAEIDMDALNQNELIIEEPRVRKQTARYGNNDSILNMSELDSSSDTGDESGKTSTKALLKASRRGKRRNKGDDEDFEMEEVTGEAYTRSECFKVEKSLLVYGWGRWADILYHGRFKRRLEEKDVENITKAMLIYSLQFYKGDERIKEFIWDLVSPSSDGTLKNHSGLSAPVPRGRKGKKQKVKEVKNFATMEQEKGGLDFDPDMILRDNGYKRHLHRHSNKVLLRVRLLYYITQEVIGEEADKVFQGLPLREIDIPAPTADGDPPAYWWDEDADRSLIIGIFKHGYEKYNLIRSDPTLAFLSRCGPPDGAALLAEQNDDDNFNETMDEKPVNSSQLPGEDPEEDISMSSMSDAKQTPRPQAQLPEGDGVENNYLPFPLPSDLNTRLRRIVTGYQRNHKKQQLKMAQKEKKMEKRVKVDAVLKERESKKRESQQNRWSRREEADFYRVVSSFGVEYQPVLKMYRWDKFRAMARLDKKYDDTLTEYFQAFYHMCMRVCRKLKPEEEAMIPNNIFVEPITEERASRCLARIDLLNKIRGEVLSHPKLDERIKLCQPSYDMPSWWICCKHDKDLLIGAARYGVVRTDFHVFNDLTLSFKEVIRNKGLHISSASPYQSPALLPGTPKGEGTPLKEEETDIEMKEAKESDADEKPSLKMEKNEEINVKEEVKEEESEEKEQINRPEVKTECKEEPSSDDETEFKNSDELASEIEEGEIVRERLTPNKEKVTPEKEKVTPNKEKGTPTKEKGTPDKENVTPDQEKVTPKCENGIERTSDSNSPVKSESAVKTEVKEEVKEEVEEEPGVKGEVKDEKNGHSFLKEELAREEEELDGTASQAYEYEMEGMEGFRNEFFSPVMQGMSLQWPKDRVIFHRLEHICYCIEHGEWPFPRRMSFVPTPGFDSRSGTPVGASTPRQDLDLSQSDAGDSVMDELNKGEGLKLTFHKRRGRRKKYEMEADRAARIQQLLNQSAAGMGAVPSSDNESQPEPMDLTPAQTPSDSLTNGGSTAPELDPVLIRKSLMEHGLLFGNSPKRRGRKRKAEKMAELAMAEALARRQQARVVATLDPESRVSVINLEDGSRLSGDEAPMKKDLDQWLDEHPGYMVDKPDVEEEEAAAMGMTMGTMGMGMHMPLPMMMEQEVPERRRGRRPRVDPAMLDFNKLTGEENVSVLNRITGKKITGAKAPPLRYLAQWLEQNPCFDVDPKWADLVRAKGNLPKSLQSRIVPPSERRGRGRGRDSMLSHGLQPGEIPFSAASLAGLGAFQSAGLLAGYHKMPLNMAFGGLPNLAMANPLLGYPGFGLPGMANLMAESEMKSKDNRSPDKKDSKSPSKSSISAMTPHPSFPMLYNPLMYNPLLAAQGLRNFSLPTSLPTSFASLSQAGFVNGQAGSESDEEMKQQLERRVHSDKAEDLSVHQATDLSVKKGSVERRDRHREDEKVRHKHREKHREKSHSREIQEEPTDLSMKPKEQFTRTKPKICSSLKLNKIVDSLKDKVQKMEDKGKGNEKNKGDRTVKMSKLENVLNKIKVPKMVEKDCVSEPKAEEPEEGEVVSADREKVEDSGAASKDLTLETPTQQGEPGEAESAVEADESS